MNIFVERDLSAPSLLRVDDVREIDVVEKRESEFDDDGVETFNTIYEVRAIFDSADGYDNSWRLVHYKSREAADAYHRYLLMTIARSGMRQESGVIVAYVEEEDALVLGKKFAKLDADSKERMRQEAEREAEGVKSDEFADAPSI